MLLKIVEMTNDLITLKIGGGDPVAIGKTLAEMITPEVETRLLAILDSSDWFEKLCGFNPKVKEHREFFTAARDSLLAEYEMIEGEGGEPEPEPEPELESGNLEADA